MTLTLVIALVLFMDGITRIVVSFKMKPVKGWGWMLVDDPEKRRSLGEIYREVADQSLGTARELYARDAQTSRVYDSAEWLARQLVGLLSRGDRRLDHEWRGQVLRCIRALSLHFDAADVEDEA